LSTATPAQWRVSLDFLLDLITSIWVFGYIIALLICGLTDGGFQLNVALALVTFALIIAYFVLTPRFVAGRIWQHILLAKPV
jgi:hypothetical protein